MRYVIIMLVSFLASTAFFQYINHAHGEENIVSQKEIDKLDKDKDKMICVTNEELDKIMVEKNYDILLNMTNADGVVESIWTGGQSIVITAAVPNEQKSCLLASMTKVTYNPKAIEEVWETYKKQTKQKDI